MAHMFDFEPFSKGRMARILEIWEACYRYRKLKSNEQTMDAKYKFIEKYNMDGSEAGTFLDVIRNYSFTEIRRYLLDNGSEIVRQGKKTRPRKYVKED
jgi:hypothetical protein